MCGFKTHAKCTEVDGSPLVALKIKHPFSGYYFVDNDSRAIESLAQRVPLISSAAGAKKRFYTGDCNEKVEDVLKEINTKYSVNVALIDSFTIACKWSTVQTLASCKRMDLIVNFPQGMSINRNLHQWVEKEASALDEFFGNQDWRDIYEQAQGAARRCIRGFLDLYERGLAKLGYRVGVRAQDIANTLERRVYFGEGPGHR